MRILAVLALTFLPNFGTADEIKYEDGPWIEIPVGMTFDEQLSPIEEIHAMADLDGDPSVTTPREVEMIALLTDLLGANPVTQ